jgi:hypothetical protein
MYDGSYVTVICAGQVSRPGVCENDVQTMLTYLPEDYIIPWWNRVS